MKLAFFILFLSFSTQVYALGEATGSRTYKVEHYTKDRNHDQNLAYKFGVFEPLASYEDPDFMDGLRYVSPLQDPRFITYDIIIVINLKNQKQTETNPIPEVAQRLRLYIRPQAMDDIGWDRFYLNSPYDPEIGLLYHWKVSSAKSGASTPTGHFNVEHFSSNNKSKNYNDAPMPWSIFFKEGLYATHGTTSIQLLGQPASHGCVRLETQRARELFHLVGAAGEGEIDILNRDGSLKVLVDGSPQRKIGYKTLFIIQ